MGVAATVAARQVYRNVPVRDAAAPHERQIPAGRDDGDARPDIRSDRGSGLIARASAETLSESSVTHTKIRPHTPTDNAEVERYLTGPSQIRLTSTIWRATRRPRR